MASSTREVDPLTPNPTTPRDAYVAVALAAQDVRAGCPSHGKSDRHNDLFSLGATLCWLLAGSAPVTGTRYRDAATALPVDVWELAPQVSRGTRDIVMKTLSGIRQPDTPTPPP